MSRARDKDNHLKEVSFQLDESNPLDENLDDHPKDNLLIEV